MIVSERYTAQLLAANSTNTLNNSAIGGFLCMTAGTITVSTAIGRVIINAFPVAAGTYYPMPFYLGEAGGTVTLAGGASGTLALS